MSLRSYQIEHFPDFNGSRNQKTGAKTRIRHDDGPDKHGFIKNTPTPGRVPVQRARHPGMPLAGRHLESERSDWLNRTSFSLQTASDNFERKMLNICGWPTESQ